MGIIFDDSYLEKVKLNLQAFIGIPSLSVFPELVHGFTTRYGGVSTGDYASLNLNFNRPDPASNVIKNYQIFSEKIGVPLENMVLSHQVHDKNVLHVDRRHGGMGLIHERAYKDIDGLITDEADLMLVTYYADCVPVYFYDPVNKVIALSHSGWKGTLLNIGVETLKMLIETYSCHPENIHVAFGPHIKACCFEVGNDVADTFSSTFTWANDFIIQRLDGKRIIDLEGIIIRNLMDFGILKEKISGCRICTKCNKDVFFSHRGNNGKTGTGVAFLMIRGKVEKDQKNN